MSLPSSRAPVRLYSGAWRDAERETGERRDPGGREVQVPSSSSKDGIYRYAVNEVV